MRYCLLLQHLGVCQRHRVRTPGGKATVYKFEAPSGELGASLRGARDGLGLVAGDAMCLAVDLRYHEQVRFAKYLLSFRILVGNVGCTSRPATCL